MEIRNIFCVGRNYANHAAELGNAVPDRPMIFSKPTHAYVLADGKSIDYPRNQGDIHHELEIVLYIGKDVVDRDFQVDEVVTHMALGVDLTLRDIQSDLKKKGHPWLLAKGFKHAAIVTDFWNFPGEAACKEKDFCLIRDGQAVQKGNISSVIFSFHKILAYIQENFGLMRGDIIYTGTPEGVGPITDGEKYELQWGEEFKGSFSVRLK
jgi:fumarylpyruvate hydrolase